MYIYIYIYVVVSRKPLPNFSMVDRMAFALRLAYVLPQLRNMCFVTYAFVYVWCNPPARVEQIYVCIPFRYVWIMCGAA